MQESPSTARPDGSTRNVPAPERTAHDPNESQKHDAREDSHTDHERSPDQKKGDEEKKEEPPVPLKERAKAWKAEHPRGFVAILIGLMFAALGAVALFLYMRTYESTDDAEVDGNISDLSARITGVATGVYVEDNEYVKQGQLLADIDPSDLQVAVAQAEANLALAQAQGEAQSPTVPITQQTNATTIATGGGDVASTSAQLAAATKDAESARAALDKAEANNRLAQLDRERSQNLVASGAISQADLDQKAAAAQAAAAELESARAVVQSSQQKIEQQKAAVGEAASRLHEVKENAPKQVQIQQANVASRDAQTKAAQAALDQARLNLSYARIVAPVSGIVGRKAVNVGDHVQPGQALFAIVQTDDLWVTANFKETQLERMHPGEKVNVSVDAFPGTFHATVESLPGASGAKYSLFPPENATGNYVKVVQRLPVRLKLDKDQAGLDRLRPGMSVEPKVFVR
jgi:membrane fusion protein (multidrug efflux system)